MKKYFYEETGMYVDWAQLKKLPEIDTLIDVGVGPDGTPLLYERFAHKKFVLIDPLDESEKFFNQKMLGNDSIFIKTALGDRDGVATINVERELGRSTILSVTDINFEGDPIRRVDIPIRRLDDVLAPHPNLGKLGIKIDTEGYELDVIRGASASLKSTKFVLAEVRHNHESFHNVYKLWEFVSQMQKYGFVLSMILTAKPFISDLCFQPMVDLGE